MPVKITKDPKGFSVYIDGDLLDTFKSQKEAEKTAQTASQGITIMTNIVQPLAAEIAAPTTTGTASTVGSALRVRCGQYKCNCGINLLTIQQSDNTLIASMTLAPMEAVVVTKNHSDEIFAGNASLSAVRCGYPRG